MKRSILLCQVVHGWGGVGPGDEVSVEDVGEVSFEGATGFSWGFAFGDLAGEVGLGLWVVALLNDRDAVERCVELAVAAAVQAVSSAGLSGAAWDGCGAAEACEGAGVAEAANVSGLGDDRRGEGAADAVEVFERAAVLGEEVSDLGVQVGDAVVEVVDVAGELADAARCCSLREAVAELDALELAQLADAVAANDAGFGDGV